MLGGTGALGETNAPSARWRRWRLGGRMVPAMTAALTLAAVGLCVLTYIELTRSPPLGPDPRTILILLNIDLVVLLLFGALVARRLVELWSAHRRGSAGSRLHVRLVALFSLLTVTPTIIVAVFSALFFNLGVQAWFSERVKTALSESYAVAEAYLEEHRNNIRADIVAMAGDLQSEGPGLVADPARLNQIVATQAAVRALSEAMVFDGRGRVLARGGLSFGLELEPVPAWALARAQSGEVALLTSDIGDKVRALMALVNMPDMYLYVGRTIEPRVLAHVDRTRNAVLRYEGLERERSSFQITFAMFFVVVALLLLLAAVWIGFNFASRLARPIGRLIEATEEIGHGNLAIRVPQPVPGGKNDELATLNDAFNRMATQLQTQQADLVAANRQLDMRRRFTEAVLSGVSAGVIGLDRVGRVNLPNRSASELLSTDLAGAAGRGLDEAVPEMAPLLAAAMANPQSLHREQIDIVRKRRSRTLLVRIAAEQDGADTLGYVVTFDDVTELLAAQRKAAWADVARRIAHEIKNPLTPIQLSAERLKRKYLSQIAEDPETFTLCTDTIVRQVEDIGRMVDEFSSFARMPAPVLQSENLVEICRSAIVLQRSAHSDIDYVVRGDDKPVEIVCDRRQIGQALTNLLLNAVDAIAGRESPEGGSLPPGRIEIELSTAPGQIFLDVLDNGRGLPPSLAPDRLAEPYVTTRAKGTGLGLAIVKKVMEDHKGDLILENREEGGVRARMAFPIPSARTETEAQTAATPAVAHGA